MWLYGHFPNDGTTISNHRKLTTFFTFLHDFPVSGLFCLYYFFLWGGYGHDMFDLGFLVEPGVFLFGMGIACFLLFRVNQVSFFLYPSLSFCFCFFRMRETEKHLLPLRFGLILTYVFSFKNTLKMQFFSLFIKVNRCYTVISSFKKCTCIFFLSFYRP